MTIRTETLSSSQALVFGFELPKGLLYLIKMDIPFGVYGEAQKKLLGPTVILDLIIKRSLRELNFPLNRNYRITFSNRDRSVWITTRFDWHDSKNLPLKISATLDTPETSCPIIFKEHTIQIAKDKSNFYIDPYSLIDPLKQLLMNPGVFINIENPTNSSRAEIELNHDWSIVDIAAKGLTL
jgi:hypothetical protein